jgi:hypothetical protein
MCARPRFAVVLGWLSCVESCTCAATCYDEATVHMLQWKRVFARQRTHHRCVLPCCLARAQGDSSTKKHTADSPSPSTTPQRCGSFVSLCRWQGSAAAHAVAAVSNSAAVVLCRPWHAPERHDTRRAATNTRTVPPPRDCRAAPARCSRASRAALLSRQSTARRRRPRPGTPVPWCRAFACLLAEHVMRAQCMDTHPH